MIICVFENEWIVDVLEYWWIFNFFVFNCLFIGNVIKLNVLRNKVFFELNDVLLYVLDRVFYVNVV